MRSYWAAGWIRVSDLSCRVRDNTLTNKTSIHTSMRQTAAFCNTLSLTQRAGLLYHGLILHQAFHHLLCVTIHISLHQLFVSLVYQCKDSVQTSDTRAIILHQIQLWKNRAFKISVTFVAKSFQPQEPFSQANKCKYRGSRDDFSCISGSIFSLFSLQLFFYFFLQTRLPSLGKQNATFTE